MINAQDYRGKVQGIVTDVNKGSLPGVKVILINEGTRVETTRISDNNGHYIFDFVEPGQYSMLVQATGFRKFEQRNITVISRGDVTVDTRLEIGDLNNEVITVQDSPALVQLNTSNNSLTLGTQLISQMAIRGRNPYNLITLDPTMNGGEAAENRPYHHAYAGENLDAGGKTAKANDIQLDGVSLTNSYKVSYTPSMEAVKEVTLQKSAVDAEFGFSSGGTVILNMKPGENDYHGTGFFYNRNPSLNAFSDPTIKRTPGMDETGTRGTNLKMWGVTMGGRIIPKKLFFYSSFENWDDERPISVKLTVPTLLERQGDFSQSVRPCTKNVPCVRTIFQPWTATGSSGVRTAFTGNKIDSQYWDPTAVKLLAQIPLPNAPGNDLNWQGFKVEGVDYWNMSHRLDYNHSDNLKTFVRWGQFKADTQERNPTDQGLFPLNGSHRYGLSLAADTVYTISPRMILNIRANYHSIVDEYADSINVLGDEGLGNLWPNSNWYQGLYTNSNRYYPGLTMTRSGSSSVANRLGRPGREWWQRPQGWGGAARMNYYLSRHSLKWGGEYRVEKGQGARFEPINLVFNEQLTANKNSSPNLLDSGSEWASFLLGALHSSTSANIIPVQELVQFGYAAYLQDDLKVNNRLTLNLGLRWEFEPGPVDAQNRLSQRLDLTNPIPEMMATPPNMPQSAKDLMASKGYSHIYNGAWVFAEENNRNAWSRKPMNFLPRIGAAIRINDKTALRMGFARYLAPSSSIRDSLGAFVSQYAGYSTTTTATTNLSGLPRAWLANPFPTSTYKDGVRTYTLNPTQLATGKSLGRYTNLGNVVSLDEYELNPQTNDRYSFAFEKEIGGRIVLSADYFLNIGRDLPYSIDLNMADPSFFYDNPSAVWNAKVKNPFNNYLNANVFPGSLRNAAEVTVGDLLRPYPQYGAITQTNTDGRKHHLHSLKFQAQRSMHKGLLFMFAYAYQREATTEFFDDIAQYNRDLTWRETDSPRHRFNYALTWELPIGRNRWLLRNTPKFIDNAIGGWQFTNMTRWYSGRLIMFNNSLNVSGMPTLDDPTNSTWFDTSMFSEIITADGRRQVRSNPYYYNGLRGPRTSQTDMTLSKTFKLTERFKLDARIEAYNVFNHLVWTNPSTSLTDANFGKVVNKHAAYIGREIQYGFRLSF